MMEAQVTYTLVAVMHLAGAALMMTRYWDASIYTTANTAFGNDNMKTLDQVFGYFGLAFWSIATITQLLSWGAIATDVNMMVWMIGHEVGFFMTLTYMLVNWYFKSLLQANIDSAAANAAESQATLDQIELNTAHLAASEALTGIELFTNMDAWGKYQWRNMPEEKQEAMKKDDDEESDGEEADEDEAAEETQVLFKMFKKIHGF